MITMSSSSLAGALTLPAVDGRIVDFNEDARLKEMSPGVTGRAVSKLPLAEGSGDVNILTGPSSARTPMQRRPDISKAKEILGWEPKVSRAEGLKITYDYFKSLSKEELNKTEHREFK